MREWIALAKAFAVMAALGVMLSSMPGVWEQWDVHAQVIGVQPTPMGMYSWNPTTNAWMQRNTLSTLQPAASTPQAFYLTGWNSTLGEWTAFDNLPLAGSGGPSMQFPPLSCSPTNYGQDYWDYTNSYDYRCTVSGWIVIWSGAQAYLPLIGGTINGNLNVMGNFTAQVDTSGPYYNVNDYGAPGTYSYDAPATGAVNINTNPNLLTLTNPIYVANGSYLWIPGAGAGGANLMVQITSGGDVTNGSQSMTFAPAATTSVSGVTIDDTLGAQAAFDACVSGLIKPYVPGSVLGGTVVFPGGTAPGYTLSGTVNAYEGCSISGGGEVASLYWITPQAGTVFNITGVTIATNTVPYFSAAFPRINNGEGEQNRTTPYYVTLMANNNLKGDGTEWGQINGLSSVAGTGNLIITGYSSGNLNGCIGQVTSSTPTSITVLVPCITYSGLNGTYSDTGTFTTVNVGFAFDSAQRYNLTIKDIYLASRYMAPAYSLDVDAYFGGRVDSGTHILGGGAGGANIAGYYFSVGGINTEFDKGWRGDSNTGTVIYWNVGANDNLAIANGTTDNGTGLTYGGSAVIINHSACSGSMYFTAHNVKHEINTNMAPGVGVYTLLDCPYASNGIQISVGGDMVWMAPATSLTNATGIMVSPANDAAVILDFMNSSISGGGAQGGTVVGIPTLTRSYMGGGSGWSPHLSYSPPFNSAAALTTAQGRMAAPMQFIGDVNINQIFQYGIHASVPLYTDTAFTALPNATTLYAGQIIAPKSYWQGANGKRYALDVVYQTGTTGTLNSGNTTCFTQESITAFSITNNVVNFTTSGNGFPPNAQVVISALSTGTYLNGKNLIVIGGPGNTATHFTAASSTFAHADVGTTSDTGKATASYQYICNSATDLSTNQVIALAGDTAKQINYVDASKPAAVLVVNGASQVIAIPYTAPIALAFQAPVLGQEIQLPTKSAAGLPPATLAWLQGDFEQNSGATANGVAAWVNVSAGTPGNWAGIPLGNSSGQLLWNQIFNPPITTGAPTVGQAACIKAAGPPVVIGYCSSVVGAGGACTCN